MRASAGARFARTQTPPAGYTASGSTGPARGSGAVSERCQASSSIGPSRCTRPPTRSSIGPWPTCRRKLRAVVVLRYLCEWSVSETATALGIAEGTVKSRLARALARLNVAMTGGLS